MHIRNEATLSTCEIKSKSEVVRAGQHVIPNPVLEYVHQAMFDVLEYIDGPSDSRARALALEAATSSLAFCQGLAYFKLTCDASNNPANSAHHQTVITVEMKSCLGHEWEHSFSSKEFL